MGGIQRRSSKLQRGVEAPRLGSGCPWNWFRVLEGMAMLVVWKTREESRGGRSILVSAKTKIFRLVLGIMLLLELGSLLPLGFRLGLRLGFWLVLWSGF